MQKSPPVILIHATLWWPLAARLAIVFRDLGAKVHAICPAVHPLHHVRGVESHSPIRSLSVQESLIESIENCKPDYIVPTDDRSVLQLHSLAASHPQYQDLVVRSLGDSKGFAVVRSRVDLLALAESQQILTPRTVALGSEQDAADYASTWHYPAVVKRDGTFGGRGVAIVSTPDELMDAYGRLRQNPSAISRLKRRLVDDDIMAFFRPGPLPGQEISLQSFVAGIPANAMYSCYKGELLAAFQVRTLCAQHATGAALIIERMSNPIIEDAGRKLAKALSYSGFMGLDFLLESGSGIPYLLEMNPRATQLGHLPIENSVNGGSLAEALWLAWTGNARLPLAAADRRSETPSRIAFYPQALALGSNNPLLTSAWLDRPDDEPDLLRELSRMSWPERRPIYRLFHRFYASPAAEPVVFPTP
jgi:hypothetical protein